MIFVNFKSYASGTGDRAERMASYCRQYSQNQPRFIPVVQAVDLYRVTQKVRIPVWAQSADAKEPVKNTGFITPYAIKRAGAAGFFINHSDCPKPVKEIAQLIKMAKKLKLLTLVFAKSAPEIAVFDKLSPDYVSLEDPQLIASDTAMVDKYEGLLRRLIAQTKTPLVVGAGIRTKAHYQEALKLGAVGVVLSSQIMEAEDPEKALTDLI